MRKKLLALSIVSAVALAACSLEDVGLGEGTETPRSAPSVDIGDVSGQEAPHSELADVIDDVLPAVVNIRASTVQFDPLGNPDEIGGQGSGVVIDGAGIILTNNHVVAGATEVDVVFNDEEIGKLEGTVLGTVPEKDIAVVQVEAEEELPSVAIGNSDSLRLGDDVLAIGFPLGLGGPTVTKGIVSAIDRNIEVGGEASGDLPSELEGLLQTDAAINPGNSGGALIDSAGQLVGINTAAARAGSAENIGFAIPIDAAIPVAQEILDEPPEKRAWLGISVQSVGSSAVAQQLGLDPDARGALVAGVFPGSPAEDAGMEQGDLIVDVGGEEVDSGDALTEALTRFDPGEIIEVTVIRDGDSRAIEVELGQRPVTIDPPE
jgi:S1-C subfamily serine protease